MTNKYTTLSSLVFLFLTLAFYSCNKEPDTLVHVSQEEFNENDKSKIGNRLKDEILRSPNQFNVLKPETSTGVQQVYDYLNSLIRTVAITDVVTHRNEFDWDVTILRNRDQYNAFITPGGNFFITIGLLELLKNESELMAMIAHELSYADNGVLLEILKKEYGADVLGDIILDNESEEITAMAHGLEDISYPESSVLEADAFSTDIICQFLYDGSGLPTFLERADSSDVDIAWLNNRPSAANRVDFLWQQTNGCGEEGQTFESRFRNFLQKLP